MAASAFLELWRRRADVMLVAGSVFAVATGDGDEPRSEHCAGTRRYRQFLERLPRAQDQPDAAEVALETHALGVDARLRAALRALNKTGAHLLVLVA
jgi:hypothetical protein